MTTSTINTTQPASGSAIDAAPVRNNFAAAASDINNLYTLVGSGGGGGVTTVSVAAANGVSGTVANATTTPAITLSLGAITPASVAATGTVTGSNLSGTNTGDQASVSGNAGTVSTINGLVAAGANVTLTGAGTQGSPYTIAAASASPGYTQITATGGNIVLTTAQAQMAHIDVIGTPTSDAVLVFPAGTPVKCSISNSTSLPAGGNSNHGYYISYNVKAQIAGQSNYVYVNPGMSKGVYGDGTALHTDMSDTFGGQLAFNFSDWAGTQDVGYVYENAPLQNFLLYCYLQALRLKASVVDDQLQRLSVRAYVERGSFSITCPIVVPPNVELYMDGDLYRQSTTGTPTNNYTGDPTTNALINLAQPCLIVTPGGHCTKATVYCNPDGVHEGSGVYVGKNWTVASFTVGAAGSGYAVGDSLYAYNPSLAPYSSAGATVASVNGSGGVTGITFVGGGAYCLPPFLQKQVWTTANGFGVFDSSGNFLTITGGSGTGCTLNPTWTADWTAGSTTYNGGNGGLVQDTLIDHIRVVAAGTTTDATYGPVYGFAVYGLNFNIGEVEVNGGYHSIYFNRAVDVRADRLNAVSGVNLLTVVSGGDINCPDVVLDTPFGGAFLNIDSTSNLALTGQMFNNGSGSVGAAAAVMLGANSAGVPFTGSSLRFGVQNAGTSGSGVPALSIAHTDSCLLDFRVTNENYNETVDTLINSFAYFGAGVGASNDIRGSIDNAAGAILTGTIPNCGIRVVDGLAGGDVGRGGLYSLAGTGAPTSGGSGTGLNKAILGSTYTNLATGLKYNQAGSASSPTWVPAADPNLSVGAIGKGFDNGTSAIAAGQAAGYTVVPYAGTITGWGLIGNASGSIVVDVWKVAAGGIPTSANSIVGSGTHPTLSSAQQATGSPTGWTTVAVAAGDVFAFSVTSAATLTHADLILNVAKS